MSTSTQYMSDYNKPSWAPPAWLFGPVWSVLYIIIIISFGYVFLKVAHGDWPFLVALPFIINIIFNLLYTPVQFGLKNLALARVIIVVVLLTIIWSMVVIYKYSKAVFYAQIPYLLWLLFATVLQFSIKKKRRVINVYTS